MMEEEQHSGNRGLLVFICCTMCIVCILIGAIVIVKNNFFRGPGFDESGRETLFSDWSGYVSDKDADGLIRSVDEEIAATDDMKKKSILYASRAGVLRGFDIENSTYEYGSQILSDAYRAEECYPTGQTAYAIYLYEQVYGDTAVAENYLNIAKERGLSVPPGRG